jgi:uncharacterized protein YigE (DUF2233 family)
MNRAPQLSIVTLILFALLGVGGPLRAEWSLESTSSQEGAGVVYVQKKIASDREAPTRMLHLVLIDPKLSTLRVVDNPGGKHSLGSAMEASGCLAGVNGGYFQSDFSPIGLMIANGRQIHPLEHGKLISGLVVVNRGRVALLRVGDFKPVLAATEALQSGPFLIDHGRPVPGLNATKPADRTVVLSDGKGGCGLLMAESVTLAEMARILADPKIVTELKISRALNLDGGSSSGLWLREPAVYLHEFKRVRSFLGVVARER